MQIRSSSTVNTTTTHVIELSPVEGFDLLTIYGTLADAVAAGYFPGVSATASDIIAVDARPQGATIVVITERTTTPADTSSDS